MDGWGAAPRLPLPPGRLFPSAQSVQPRPQWETAVVPPGQPLQQCCPGCGVSGNVASEAGRTGYGVMELMYGRHECGASWTSTRLSQGVGCAGLMIVWLHQGRRDAQQIASESDAVPNCQGAFSIGKSRETEVGHAAEANVVVQMQPNSAARVPHGGGHARAGRPSAVMCRNCRLRQKRGTKNGPHKRSHFWDRLSHVWVKINILGVRKWAQNWGPQTFFFHGLVSLQWAGWALVTEAIIRSLSIWTNRRYPRTWVFGKATSSA